MRLHRSKLPLIEGMREGDLADLVLPLISVDEYESKVSQQGEAIVFGFYVHDQAAADDLNRFLQKSAIPILDTEVSPAPDQHGYFMVFVELTTNTRMAENVDAILSEIKGLVDIDEWQMRVRDMEELLPFNQETLIQALKSTEDKVAEQRILKFLQPSVLNNASIDGSMLILEGGSERFVFNVLGFDHLATLLREHRLKDAGIAYNVRAIARTNRIARILGEAWDVMELNGRIILHRDDDSRGLLVI